MAKTCVDQRVMQGRTVLLRDWCCWNWTARSATSWKNLFL